MIILDTNVLSEPARPQPSDAVLRWLDAQERKRLYTTAVTYAEILLGIEAMPAGRRRDRVVEQMTLALDEDLGGRILAFDDDAARAVPLLGVKRSRFRIEPDIQIAAIARAHNAVLATRNVKDFEGYGLDLINPWTA